MSADSVEKRALFEKVVIDGRKKMLNETLINSDSECSGNWWKCYVKKDYETEGDFMNEIWV